MKALWNGETIASSDETIVIEGNHYFPAESVDKDCLDKSDLVTTCGWKGDADYYHLKQGDKTVENAAWYYATPLPNSITRVGKDYTNYIAFYPNVVDITD